MNPSENLPTPRAGVSTPTRAPAITPNDVARTETNDRALRWIAALFVAASVVTVWTWSGRLNDGNLPVAGDAFYTYAAARSLAWDADLDLTNQLMVLGDRWGLGQAPAADGTRLPVRELGPALLMVPGLWLHHLVHAPVQQAPRYAAIVGSMCLGVCLLLVGAVLRRVCPDSAPRARIVATMFPLGFVVPFYSLGHVGYPHALDATVCTLIFGALATRRHPALAGLAIAAGVLVRLQNFLWLLWPLLTYLKAPVDQRKKKRGALLVTASVASLGIGPQAFMGLAHPGSATGPIRWGLNFFNVEGLAADLWTVVAGPHGLWSATPLALLACLGLALALRDRSTRSSPHDADASPSIALAAAVVTLALVVLMATVRDPDSGHAFGARRLAGLTPIFAFGTLRFVEHATASGPRIGRFVDLAVGGLIFVNLVRTMAAITGALPLAP